MVMGETARLPPRRRSNRWRISAAAWFVKVTAVISWGRDPQLLHQIGDTGDQCFGLSCTWPRHHGHHGLWGGDSSQLLWVQFLPARRGVSRFDGGSGGGEDLGFVGEVSLFLRGKKRKLTAESLDLTGSQKGDDTILPVKARTAVYLAQPQAADAIGHTGAGQLADVWNRGLAQDIELWAQAVEQALVPLHGPLCRGGGASGGGDNLW